MDDKYYFYGQIINPANTENMFNEQDAIQLSKKGINSDYLQWQLEMFHNGAQFISLKRAASLKDGIIQLSETDINKYINIFESSKNISKMKFVPASGAASRMFKSLFEFIEDIYSSFPGTSNDFIDLFFNNISKFAFYDDLKKSINRTGKTFETLIDERKFNEILACLLEKKGMNYGQLPKGLLHFHKYKESIRTPFEEHMVEGALYAATDLDEVRINYTISPEHQEGFKNLLEKKKGDYESEFGVIYYITFSVQKTSTDTMAVDENNKPFRNNDQSILFRPGGHGALLENLNELKNDIIFIKNIDNVVTQSYVKTTVIYKKALAGLLLDIRNKVFQVLEELDSGQLHQKRLVEIMGFIRNELFYETNKIPDLSNSSAAIPFFRNILNRPIRVCGVVRNLGEPGGGPFWAPNSMGDISLQIVESSQVDIHDPKQKEIFNSATHFNPVDLVCSTINYKGNKFNLTEFVDKNTCFISKKSKDGKELKALELPGLWNGSMSDWLTIFVEVPIETFNPVKTVNDLLREQHQMQD
jgi:hypothetical protein